MIDLAQLRGALDMCIQDSVSLPDRENFRRIWFCHLENRTEKKWHPALVEAFILWVPIAHCPYSFW